MPDAGCESCVIQQETRASYKIGEIASWMYGPKHFSMKVRDVQSGDKLIFQTPAGQEITDLLEDYIEALVNLRRKYTQGTLSGVGLARGAAQGRDTVTMDTLPLVTMKRAPEITGRRT